MSLLRIKLLGPNQTEVHINGSTIFFSYETPVAAIHQGTFYRCSQKYSVTTSKHITQWLDGAKAQTVGPDFFDGLLRIA